MRCNHKQVAVPRTKNQVQYEPETRGQGSGVRNSQLTKASSLIGQGRTCASSPCRESCANPRLSGQRGQRLRPSILTQVGLLLRVSPVIPLLCFLTEFFCLCFCQLGFCFLGELAHFLHLRLHQLNVIPGGYRGLICSCQEMGQLS